MHYSLASKTRLRGIALTAALAAMLAAVFVIPGRSYSQESHSATAQAKSPAAHESAKEPGAKDAKEASDETEAFKHSGPVRFVARITGLSIDAAYWICVVLNFAIIVVLLWVPLRKRLPGLFKSRTDSIQQRLAEARRASEEARARLGEVEGRLSRLDAEIAAMRREADENARAEEKRVAAEAEEERRRIVSAAEQEIASAFGAARRDLKAYAGELAVDLAAKRIRVDADADKALVRDFTTQLGKDGN